MYQAIPYVYDPHNHIYIDVRSESEYKTGHIIGAINMPILYDLERHEVGWIYKNSSVEEAKRVGLKYGSEKLHIFYDTLFKLRNEQPEKKIIFYCARGGYRSRSIALLMRSIDLPVFWLQGGYKGYRNEVLKKLNQPVEAFPNSEAWPAVRATFHIPNSEQLIVASSPSSSANINNSLTRAHRPSTSCGVPVSQSSPLR